MKLSLKVILIAGLSFFMQQVLPWWVIAPVAFLVATSIKSSGFSDFMAGFLGVGLLWMAMAWWIDLETDSILTQKIAVLFNVGKAYVIILVTGLTGGIVGGFGALSGHFLRKTLKP